MVIYGKCNGEILPKQSINYISHEYINQIYSHRFSLREDLKKKTVKRVTLSLLGLEPTYPT